VPESRALTGSRARPSPGWRVESPGPPRRHQKNRQGDQEIKRPDFPGFRRSTEPTGDYFPWKIFWTKVFEVNIRSGAGTACLGRLKISPQRMLLPIWLNESLAGVLAVVAIRSSVAVGVNAYTWTMWSYEPWISDTAATRVTLRARRWPRLGCFRTKKSLSPDLVIFLSKICWQAWRPGDSRLSLESKLKPAWPDISLRNIFVW